jgi:hypothetical protein
MRTLQNLKLVPASPATLLRPRTRPLCAPWPLKVSALIYLLYKSLNRGLCENLLHLGPLVALRVLFGVDHATDPALEQQHAGHAESADAVRAAPRARRQRLRARPLPRTASTAAEASGGGRAHLSKRTTAMWTPSTPTVMPPSLDAMAVALGPLRTLFMPAPPLSVSLCAA